MRYPVLLLPLFLSLIVPVRAQDDAKPFDTTVDVKFAGSGHDEMNNSEYGNGASHDTKMEFTANMKSWATQPVENVTLKLYVVAKTYGWEKSQIKEAILKVLTKEGVRVDNVEDTSVSLGEVDFNNFEASKTGGNVTTITRGGLKYCGYVLEVYKQDKLIDTLYSKEGGEYVKDAYEKQIYFDESKSKK